MSYRVSGSWRRSRISGDTWTDRPFPWGLWHGILPLLCSLSPYQAFVLCLYTLFGWSLGRGMSLSLCCVFPSLCVYLHLSISFSPLSLSLSLSRKSHSLSLFITFHPIYQCLYHSINLAINRCLYLILIYTYSFSLSLPPLALSYSSALTTNNPWQPLEVKGPMQCCQIFRLPIPPIRAMKQQPTPHAASE